ncbi:MAG: hypothetical protein V1790_04760, partial [Planctomycetota bacterium]
LQNPQPPNAICCPPKDFHTYESATCTGDPVPGGGCARWVGKPGTFYERQGPPLSEPYRAARLQCSPFYADWVTETASGAISVVGAEIMPSSEYSVKTYAASCTGDEDTCTNVGTAVTMKTRRSGDAETPYNPPGAGQEPTAGDVTALVNKWKKVANAPLNFRSQLQPNLPELNTDVSASDIVAVVDAYNGKAYPYGGPCPCPSLATCGAFACGPTVCTWANICVGGSNNGGNCTPPLLPTACTGGGVCTLSSTLGLGAEAICVKTCPRTCVGGPTPGIVCTIDGDCGSGGVCSGGGAPCISNEHCPAGQTCGSPFCRDKCGRCTP